MMPIDVHGTPKRWSSPGGYRLSRTTLKTSRASPHGHPDLSEEIACIPSPSRDRTHRNAERKANEEADAYDQRKSALQNQAKKKYMLL